MKKVVKSKSDFRYSTGDSKVPWAAVGESINVDDISSIIRFLIPGANDDKAYNSQLSKIHQELGKLLKEGSYASKLSLGDNVKALEEPAVALVS